MTQTSKKSSSAASTKSAATKFASDATHKVAKTTLAAVESTRSSAENVAKVGGKAVKDFMATSAEEAQKAQEKVFALGREGAEKIVKSADAVSKAMYEAVELSRDGVETYIECANLGAALAKDMSTEMFEVANQAFSDTVELSKDFFAARTLNDVFELQNRMIKNSIDLYFNQSVKLSGMMFEYSTEALEPINERLAQSAEQFTKILSGNR